MTEVFEGNFLALSKACHNFAAPQISDLGLKKKMTPKNLVFIPAIGRHLYLKVDRFAKMSKSIVMRVQQNC